MKKITKIMIFILVLVLTILYFVHWAFFDLQRIKGQEIIGEVPSPNGEYTIVVYLNSGGATTDFATLCSAVNNISGKERNIYWKYHCSDAQITWKDDQTVIINGIELDILKDSYDYRNN